LTLNSYTSIYVYFIVHHLKSMFNIDWMVSSHWPHL
jgi:hypothetical protein